MSPGWIGGIVADRAAFDLLMQTGARRLLRTAILLTGDHHLGEDLLQSALHKTYLHWGRLREDEAGEAYVRVVMTRMAIRSWRRKWRAEVPTENLPDSPGSDDAFAAVDQRDVLRRALMQLPPRQRAIVVLRYYNDLSESQIADELGVSVGTVKNSAFKGLQRLRELVPAAAAPAVIQLPDSQPAVIQLPDHHVAPVDPAEHRP
jgi:RNA polymerase sigma-70 factor (sigma-E family)